jgi:hypothetical protein
MPVTPSPQSLLGLPNTWSAPQAFAGGISTPTVYPILDATGVYDGEYYTIPMTWTNGQNTLTIGNTLSTTATITTALQNNNLSIIGSQPLTQTTHQFHPTIINLGGGVLWRGIVLGVANSGGNQTVTLSTGAPAVVTSLAGASIKVGMQLTSADVGRTVSFGWSGAGGGSYTGTIATVTGANTVTTSSNINVNASGSTAPIQMMIGTDNYTSLNAAVQAALAARVDTLQCDSIFLVTKIPAALNRLILVGKGRLLNTSNNTDASPPSAVLRPVVPASAPSPTPLRNEVAKSSLALLTGKTTVNVCLVGASTATEDPGSAAFSTSWVRRVEMHLQAQNPSVTFNWTRYAQGGGNTNQYVGWSSPVVGDWYVSGKWVGNATLPGYAYNAAPDLLVIEWSANDAAALGNITAFVALIAMVKNWPTPPAILVVYHIPESAAQTNINLFWWDNWSMGLSRLCSNMGVGFIDLTAPIFALRNGYDVRNHILERVPPPTTTVTNYNPTLYGCDGWELAFFYTGTPLAFWTAMGNMASFPMASDNDGNNTIYANNFIVGYDQADGYPGAPSATPDALWMRGDFGRQLPGFALQGGTQPRLYGTYAMTSGSNAITYTPYLGGPANAWVSGDNGKIVTVVGAGSTSTGAAVNVRATPVPVGGNAIGHLVGYLHYISGTSATIFADAALTVPLNAVTTISGQSFGVLFGSPRVYSSITGIAAGGSGTQILRVSVRDGEAVLNYGGNSRTLRRACAQPGSFGMSMTYVLNGNPAATYANAPGSTSPEFFISKTGSVATRALVRPSKVDDDVVGPNSYSGVVLLKTGGSGGNHPSELIQDIYTFGLTNVNLTIP